VAEALPIALKNGYRLIDTAWVYKDGLPHENEAKIGQVLQEFFKSNELELKREDIFVTTKLFGNLIGEAEDWVKEQIDKSLKALKLAYVDLYLVSE
jgi:diketogulonate reductase-like aldo/keto reductase